MSTSRGRRSWPGIGWGTSTAGQGRCRQPGTSNSFTCRYQGHRGCPGPPGQDCAHGGLGASCREVGAPLPLLPPSFSLPVPDRGEDALAGDDHGAAGLRGPRAPGSSSVGAAPRAHGPYRADQPRLQLLPQYLSSGPFVGCHLRPVPAAQGAPGASTAPGSSCAHTGFPGRSPCPRMGAPVLS